MKFNLQKMIRPHLIGMKSYQNSRNSCLDQEMCFLDANENPFGKYNRYPDSEHLQLKVRLAEINQVQTENLFLGNGSDELIDLAMRIFCEPAKDSVSIVNPSFVMYEIYAKMNNLKVEKLELNTEFQLDKTEFQNTVAATKSKLLFLCSPNNPTGNSINDLEFYIQNFKGIVVVDEAYIEFSPEVSCVSLLSKYSNLIVLKTLSKAFGMAGLRIGIGISSPEIAHLFNACKPPYNLSLENQKKALKQLSKLEGIKNNIAIIIKEKEKLEVGLALLSIVSKIYPSDANFLLVKFKNAELVFKILAKHKILTSLRHPNLKNCLRISIGNAEENLKLLMVLKEIAES